MQAIRRGLRMWENGDIVPRPDDIFQERLYCIRWVETYVDAHGELRVRRHYRAPTTADLRREARVLELLRERFDDWQARGYLPGRRIEPGNKTDEPIRTRGWTCWHHLFNPRQLLLLGLLAQESTSLPLVVARVACLLGINNAADLGSRLCIWNSTPGKECVVQTFANQALNTLANYGCKGLANLKSSFFLRLTTSTCHDSAVRAADARAADAFCDLWVTDPPYADAVNYHELSEFFLAWDEKGLVHLFPEWYTDSKRVLAITGSATSFKESMVECYSNIARHMPDNGLQIVMFTHRDAGVWADLTMILWAAGLCVTAAWTIATETSPGFREGNYVQGTVLLVLRKRAVAKSAFLDEIMRRVEVEVRRQLDSMLALEDASDPNFDDADYQLAAYAAALRVLTTQPIEEIDPLKELLRVRARGEVSAVEDLIRDAVKIACNHLVPRGLERELWLDLNAYERFYLKGLEVESHGEYRSGVYQELARGFGAAAYTDLLASTHANETRLKCASELGRKGLGSGEFGGSLVRQALYAITLTAQGEQDAAPRAGLNYLKTELPDYWGARDKLIRIADYLAALGAVGSMAPWRADARAAAILAGALRNDHA
jgi:putative DNA methylase